MIDYQVITNNDPKQLANDIHKMIQAGYVPQGGVSVGKSANSTTYAQAMVKD